MFSLIYRQFNIEIFIDIYVYGLAHTSTSSFCQVRGPKEMKPYEQRAHPVSRSGFLIPFSKKRNQGFLEKWLILEPEHEIHNMSRKHLTVQESKKGSRKKLTTITVVYQNDTEVNRKSFQCPKLKKFEQQNKVELDYKSKYKIPMLSILI